MTKYLISFPGSAMQIPADEFPAVGAAARAVIQEAKAAGVYVFGGGIDEEVPAVAVRGDGTLTETYADSPVPDGGYTILELPTREAAVEWAAKIAAACRCAQEVRAFQYDPES